MSKKCLKLKKTLPADIFLYCIQLYSIQYTVLYLNYKQLITNPFQLFFFISAERYCSPELKFKKMCNFDV